MIQAEAAQLPADTPVLNHILLYARLIAFTYVEGLERLKDTDYMISRHNKDNNYFDDKKLHKVWNGFLQLRNYFR